MAGASGKKALKSDAEVKAAVDSLLGEFGVIGEAEGDFDESAVPVVKNGGTGQHLASSGDDLWGGKKK